MRAIKRWRFAFFLIAIAPGFAGDLFAGDLEDGIAAYNGGRYSVAIPLLRRASEATGDPRAGVFLALSSAAANDCAAALPALVSAATHGVEETSLLAGLAAARCQNSAGDAALALSTLASLRQRFPKNADVLYLMAETEMSAFNRTTFSMFQEAPASYRTHQLSAEILEIQERYDDAVSEYKKAIQQNPNAPDLHYRLGRAILLRSHSPDALTEAQAAFTAELKLSPEDSASFFQLGLIAQAEGRTADAALQFEQALHYAPEFASAMIALAKTYSQQNQPARAIALLRKATALQPDNESAHYALLTAYRNAGKLEEAKQEKAILDRLQKPPASEFSDFLKKLGEKPPQP